MKQGIPDGKVIEFKKNLARSSRKMQLIMATLFLFKLFGMEELFAGSFSTQVFIFVAGKYQF